MTLVRTKHRKKGGVGYCLENCTKKWKCSLFCPWKFRFLKWLPFYGRIFGALETLAQAGGRNQSVWVYDTFKMQWVSSPLTAAVLSILLQGIIGASSSSDYKVVCYLESWSIYWKDPQLSFGPSNIDPFACTHLIHSFIGLDNSTFLVRILDPDYEVDKGGFKAAVDLKLINPQLKVMIAIGGWAEGGLQYSQMVSTRQRRKNFINSLVEFIETYQFDGLDFDWEYPGDTTTFAIELHLEITLMLSNNNLTLRQERKIETVAQRIRTISLV